MARARRPLQRPCANKCTLHRLSISRYYGGRAGAGVASGSRFFCNHCGGGNNLGGRR